MISYKDAGVDVEAGYEAVQLMKEHVRKTFDGNVMGDLGSFGGFYSLENSTVDKPVLVAGTDGVGTKLKIAFLMDKHDTVGIDCVAMCANDVVCQGAAPLFFLDYLATGKLEPEKAASIVSGIAEGCLQAGCALIGGETAEMPGFYTDGEYDMAGFCVGLVGKDQCINGKNIQPGDVLVGLPSSGVHSNGFSLVRKLLITDGVDLNATVEALGCTLGEELLKPTRIYVKTILSLLKNYELKGIAHITGGGFIENIPRILPQGLAAKVNLGSWPVLPIFDLLQQTGNIAQRSIYNTFNMGIGMVLAVDKAVAQDVVNAAQASGEQAYIIGEVTEGEGVELC